MHYSKNMTTTRTAKNPGTGLTVEITAPTRAWHLAPGDVLDTVTRDRTGEVVAYGVTIETTKIVHSGGPAISLACTDGTVRVIRAMDLVMLG